MPDKPLLRNVNPLGQVDLPLIYREGGPYETPGKGCLEPGETFEVSAEHAEILLRQVGNYEPANKAAEAISARLRAETPAESAADDDTEHSDDDTRDGA